MDFFDKIFDSAGEKPNIQRYSARPLLVAALALLLAGYSCGGGGGGGGEGGGGSNTVPEIEKVQSVIGAGGGELMMENTGSPADGAKVIIPESALAADHTITISYGETDIDAPAGIDPAGGEIDLGPDGLQFLLPVHISIPYLDDDNDGIIDGTGIAESKVKLIYYNEADGNWEEIAVVNRNAERNLVEAETYHFSTYLVGVDPAAGGGSGGSGGTAQGYEAGEYFVGPPEYRVSGDGNRELIVKGCIAQDNSACSEGGNCRPCGSHYVLTVTADNGPIKAVVDKRATHTGGVPATINEDGTGFIFNAASVFEKIRNSGDAALWTWRCEFITEHTHLRNFLACDESNPKTICSAAGVRIVPRIDVVDESNIQFGLGIDISDGYDAGGKPVPGNAFYAGDMIAVRFEANYNQ